MTRKTTPPDYDEQIDALQMKPNRLYVVTKVPQRADYGLFGAQNPRQRIVIEPGTYLFCVARGGDRMAVVIQERPLDMRTKWLCECPSGTIVQLVSPEDGLTLRNFYEVEA